MSKDYKKPERRPCSRGGAGSLLVGILIGLVLGLSIALGVAWYINKMPSPFLARGTPQAKPGALPDAPRDSRTDERTAKAAPESKPRVDFYNLTNEASIINWVQTVGTAYHRASTVQPGLLIKLGGNYTF